MGSTDDHPNKTPETERCEFCNRYDESVSTQMGRRELRLRAGCDSWIARRMSQMEVSVPADFMCDTDDDPPSTTTLQEWIVWTEFKNIDAETSENLRNAGFWTPEDVSESSISRLASVEGVNRHLAHLIMDTAMYNDAGFPTESPSEVGNNDSDEGNGLGDPFD